jgi:uncharacterized membrane protein YdbT with pleckstrin-like domain
MVAEAAESPAAAKTVPAQLLAGGEVVLLAVKPSLWFVLFVSFNWLLAAAVVVTAVAVSAVPAAWRAPLIQVAIAAAAARVLVAMLQWVSRLYILTDRRIMMVRGVFHVDLFECSLAKIQHTHLSFRVYERLLRLGSIGFATAGTGAVEAVWLHIARPLAVHQLIREAIERAKRGRPEPATEC